MCHLSIAAIAAASTVAFTQIASAADMPVKAPVVAPAPTTVVNWTGGYIGLSAGGAWGNADLNNVIFNDGPPPAHDPQLLADVNALNSVKIKSSGALVGVQAGYDVQVNQFVYGGVGDFSWMNLRGSRDAVSSDPSIGITNITLHDDIRTNWLLTLRGRLGWAAGNFLIYATGGAAATHVKYGHTYSVAAPPVTVTESDSASDTRWGWVVGGGVDYALSNRWSVRAEYLHLDFGTVVNDQIRVVATPTGPLNTVFGHNISLTADLVRIGVNFKLN